jgi:hypothetical protein
VGVAVKRVQKLTTALKAAIIPGGAKRDSGGKSNKALQQLQ